LHVDTTTSANGTCEISQEFAEDIFEDQGNVIKGLSEASNQSSEDNSTNISGFSPTSKGKPGHSPLFYLHCNLYLFIYFYALSSQELLGTLVAFFQEPMY
jgi:hypothetical protein